jgi:YspA, cpYpsA-related SLOG family
MRLAVIGSKDFHDYSRLKTVLYGISGITTIVSGAADGTDSLAAKFALEHNIKLIEFPPDFEQHGEDAKHARDRLIVENSNQLIAFWDGKCEGTRYTIDYAEKLNVQVMVVET